MVERKQYRLNYMISHRFQKLLRSNYVHVPITESTVSSENGIAAKANILFSLDLSFFNIYKMTANNVQNVLIWQDMHFHLPLSCR